MPTLLKRSERVKSVVVQSEPASVGGMLERLFALAFGGLVYPQIWEDPDVDMQALARKPGARLVTIASGGCNVLAYLLADPKEIIAVDLNPAHVALTRLKLAAARMLPAYSDYYRFFGEADDPANVAAYKLFLRDRIDAETRRYWDGRDLFGRRRIGLFSRALYRHGLSGRFIGLGHWLARRYGVDVREMTAARSVAEQQSFFDNAIAPLFDKPFVRWITSYRAALFGLGIPPAQYVALAGGDGSMAGVLKTRLERLACAFPLSENYFAWQAFGRGYAPGGKGPLPAYLVESNFPAIRNRAERVKVVGRSFTEQLQSEPAESLDAYVLLDAQDWMTDAQLNELWSEITRTARPGARVIFRTAGEPTILPGRIDDAILDRWAYDAPASRVFFEADRSSAYGGFHLYTFRG